MPSILDQLLGNGGMQEQPNVAQQILSARFQPSQDDVAQSIFRNTTGFNGSASYSPVSPQQVMGQNQTAMIDPYKAALQAQGLQMQNDITAQTGLPMAQADLQKQLMANQIQQQTGLPLAQAQLQNAQTANQYQPQMLQADIANKNAMSGYYGNSLQRDLAEKQFQYANDPQMAQARMMAAYMQGLSGAGQSPQQPQLGMPQINASDLNSGGAPSGAIPMPPTPSNLAQSIQQNAQPAAQGGFNPMGAMLAKQLGLTDMQIGPNGQPMPIPGSMKMENGQVITFGPDGTPTQTVPKNPVARQSLENTLGYLSDKLDELKKNGSAVDEDQNWFQNQLNSGLASNMMQPYEAGTKGQTIRKEMASYVMTALPDYMQAKGLTPGMEKSLGGQELILQAIGIDPKSSTQANKDILANISRVSGTGKFAQSLGAIASAREAIAKGAPRDAVMKRLQDAGINAPDL